jgi:hypothetical protein
MRGPVVTGIRTTRNRPFAYPIWGSNGRPGNRIQWDAHTRQIGGVKSLNGQYITTITHNLHNPIQGEQVQIGLFTLAQVRDLFPLIGVIYAMNYQLLESNEAKDWLWIRSYIEPVITYDNAEQEHHQFNLRRPSL